MGKKILNILTTILLISLIALLVAMFIARASGNSLSIFGLQLYRVSSGSMTPALEVGDVILVNKTSCENIHEGDIITYRSQEGVTAGSTITHRVVEEPKMLQDGTWLLRTRGDANDTDDPQIKGSQVLGKYVRTLPIISRIYSFFLTPYGLITLIVVILALFGYEMISLVLSYRSFDKVYDQYSEPPSAASEAAEKTPEGEAPAEISSNESEAADDTPRDE